MENQILTKEQVQELKELGFDTSKYSNIGWACCKKNCPNLYCSDPNLSFRDNYRLFIGKKENCGLSEIIPSLTIGDIIDALPEQITIRENKEESVLFSPYILETDMKTYLRYIACFNGTLVEIKRNEKFINMLFDLLKWCIVNKHIKASAKNELNKLKEE